MATSDRPRHTVLVSESVESSDAGSSTAIAGIIGLSMAAAGAALLFLAEALWTSSADIEAASTLAWIAGWTLLLWAVIIVAVVVVQLARSARRRAPTLVEVVLVVATVAVILGAFGWLPPFGTGGGTG